MLALTICILLPFSTAARQMKVEPSIVGSWMGAIEAGGAKMRLVFEIAATDNGELTGTVGSPDKGIKGINLSRVHVNGDSVVFAIASAYAGFEGKFIDAKTAITGNWKEGGIVFPLTLNRITDTTGIKGAYDFAKQSAVPLSLQKTSRHFDFYSCDGDSNALDDIAKTLEDNTNRITDHLKIRFTERIRVYIYPDVKTFHTAIYWPDAPDWAIGAAGINEMKMVSPLNPGSAHTYASLMQAIVHELVHSAVINAVGLEGLSRLPKWLNEGYAFYEAGQMTDDMRESVKSHVQEKAPPTWNQLNPKDIVEFGNMGGYQLSTTIIEFLVKKHGFKKLMKLIEAPDELETIYGRSMDVLEKQWVQYIKNM